MQQLWNKAKRVRFLANNLGLRKHKKGREGPFQTPLYTNPIQTHQPKHSLQKDRLRS